ncbi:MAG: IclR family transcriptional regulator [Streptosporangiaceae bacterium]
MPAEDGRQARGNSAATVERAADVLLLFARSTASRLGVTEIARTLGLSKPAVHRILSSLRNKGIVELDPISRKYMLGPVIVSLGLTYLNKLDVRKVAGPELADLSRITSETATLSVRTGHSRVYVDQVTPGREVLMSVQIGIPYPLHAGSSSKAFLAFLPDEEIEQYLQEPLRKLTPHTVTDPRKLRRELAEIRERGWAQSLGERQPGAGSVAAPILDYRSYPLAVVSVCGPAERLAGEVATCARHLLASTRRISVRMGHSLDPAGEVPAP